MRARTLSLTHTWTLRTGSVGPTVPDWTLWARRAPEGTLTRPGTPPVGGTDDVERGLDRKDITVSVAEPQVAVAPAEDEALNIVASVHVRDMDVDPVPERGVAAAMISGSGAAAGPVPAIDIEVALAPAQQAIPALEQVAVSPRAPSQSISGVVLTCRSRAPQAPAEPGSANVNVKRTAAGNERRAVKLALPSSVLPHVGEAGTDALVQSPTTPSPSPTLRSVRFPVPPRLASHEAADRDRAPSAGFSSQAKEVHFSDEQGADPVVGGAMEGDARVGEGVPGGGGGGGGGVQDAHFPASQ